MPTVSLDKLYKETYNLGCSCANLDVFYDFDNLMLYFRPVRVIGTHPVNELTEEMQVKLPKFYHERQPEVKRVLGLFKDDMYSLCQKYDIIHDYDRHPHRRYV